MGSAARRSRGRAIKDSWLRIPQGSIPSQILKGLCSHTYSDRVEVNTASLENGQWVLPREVISDKTLKWVGLDVHRVGPRCRRAFLSATQTVDPRNAETERQTRLQQQAFDCLVEEGGGVVQLPPGTGKTALSFLLMQHWQVPALVTCHTKGLQKQWGKRAESLMGLPRDRILYLGGVRPAPKDPVELHEHLKGTDLVLATIQTLSKRPELLYLLSNHVGLAIYDEVHHCQGKSWQKALPVSHWYRVGLSATVQVDGLESVFLNHIGPIIYRSEETDLDPTFFRIPVPALLSQAEQKQIKRPVFLGKKDKRHLQDLASDQDTYYRLRQSLVSERTMEAHISRSLSAWAAHPNLHSRLRANVLELASQGRKQLVLSSRKDHLRVLYDAIGPEHAALIIEDADTVELLNSKDIILATYGKVGEGLDRPDLDTLHLPLPWSRINPFIQITGRIVRACEGKEDAQVHLYVPKGIDVLERMCRRFLGHARRYKYPIKTKEVRP